MQEKNRRSWNHTKSYTNRTNNLIVSALVVVSFNFQKATLLSLNPCNFPIQVAPHMLLISHKDAFASMTVIENNQQGGIGYGMTIHLLVVLIIDFLFRN